MFRRAVLSLVLCLAAALPSQAQLFRAYVSLEGSDTNPCTLLAPCRLLPAALNAVAPGGEIWMVDSANYNTGTVAITKSVTILAIPGAVGSVVAASGGNAMQVSGDTSLTLRNIVIVNLNGGGAGGVAHTGSGSVNLIDCDISGLTDGSGVSATGSGSIFITVRGTVMRGNSAGITAVGPHRVTVDRSQFTGHSGRGIQMGSSTRATISNSVFSGNGTAIYAQTFGSGSAVTTTLEVLSSTLANNDRGIDVQSFSTGDVLNLVVRGNSISCSNLTAIRVDERAGTTLTAIVDNNSIVNNSAAYDFGGVTTGASLLTRGNNTVLMNTTIFPSGGATAPLTGS